MPQRQAFGKVVGCIIRSVGDGEDADLYPDEIPAQGFVYFTPKESETTILSQSGRVARAAHETIEAVIDPTTGELSSKKTESGNVLLVPGVWLTLGEWKVTFRLTIGTIAPIETIVVIADHADHPLDLFTYQPYVPPAESEVTTLLVPSGHFDGAVLGYQAGALKWLPGVEAIQDAVARAEEVLNQVLNLVDVGQHLYSPNASVSGALDLTSFEKKAIIHRTLTGNITEVFLPTTPIPGLELTLVLTQDATGGRTFTITGVKASYGVPFTLTATPGGVDVLHLFFTGAGWIITPHVLNAKNL